MPKPKNEFEIDEAALDAALNAQVEADEVVEQEEPTLTRLHAILSDKELQAAKDEARAAIEKERKAAATKAVIAEEKLRLQREEGLISGDPVKDEMVKITIDLPEYSNSITINMEPFYHGYTYTVPRHVANSMKEQMQRAWIHQDEIDGKTLAQNLQQRRDTTLTPTAIINAPQVPA